MQTVSLRHDFPFTIAEVGAINRRRGNYPKKPLMKGYRDHHVNHDS